MLTLQNPSHWEVTILSNYFIDRYMPRANGEFVKVYLYLLRMSERMDGSLGLEQLADHLFCTEGDILRALKYWEAENLLHLEYGPAGELTAIFFREPRSVHTEETAAAASPHTAAGTTHTDHTPTAPSDAGQRKRPALTPDRVKELKKTEDVVQLLYIAEQYLGKTLTPTEAQKLLFFYDGLKMSLELIEYLIEYCVGRGHKSMRYMETVAMAWDQEGITTVAMAKESTSRYGKEYFTILKCMGISNRNPVDTEIAIMNVWLKDYGFSMDLIREACTRTVLQTGQPSFQYADKILTQWLKKGVHSKEDIARLDTQHQKRKKTQSKPAPSNPQSAGSNNKFNNFHQRDYNFDEYEKKLLNQ